MTVNSRGNYGEPLIEDPPSTIPDMTAISQYAGLVGNRIIGTSTQRANFSATYGFAPYIGIEFFEHDTANEYMYVSAGWIGTSTDGAIVAIPSSSFSPDGSGYSAEISVQFRNSTRFTAPPVVTFGPFTTASQSQHAGVFGLVTYGFVLYYWRENRVDTSVGWTATPYQI